MVLAGIGIILFGLILIGWGVMDKKNIYKRVGEPPTGMGSLESGKVAVTGMVRALSGLTSPASKHSCTYYEECHEQRTRPTRQNKSALALIWRTVAVNARGIFLIDDGTGRAVVWPYGAEMDFTRPWSYESLRAAASVPPGILTSRKSDRFISEGDYVYVRGTRHTRDELLIKVKDPNGPGIPQEAFEALIKDADLKNLPCFFKDGNYFAVADQVYSARFERLGASSGVLAMVGGLMLLMGAFVAVSALLGFA